MNELTHIDLFSGIGGFALAARWNGIKTVQFVEIDKFCHKVLNKNFPGVPIHDDITTFAISESRESGEQTESEGRKDIGGRNSEVFLLTGGFPCQPFSCAGKRKGTSDSRHLWPHMLRVIKEFKPKWIIGENVSGIINIKGMEQQDSESELESETVNDGSDGQPSTVLIGILNDLEQAGYSVQIFVIPACAVNAPHRRDRVWIVGRKCDHEDGNNGGRFVANTGSGRLCGQELRTQQQGGAKVISANPDSHAPDTEKSKCELSGRTRARREGFTDGCFSTAFPNGARSEIRLSGQDNRKERNSGIINNSSQERNWWKEPWLEVATRLCRVDDGLPRQVDRVNRLKALGNAIVPQVASQIMKAILQAENEA